MNLGYIRGLVRKKLGETTAAFWLDSEINGYINDGMLDIAYKTKCIITDITWSAFYGQSSYGMQATLGQSSPAYSITEMYYYNPQSLKWFKMRATSRTELDETNLGWQSAPNALPYQYWWDRELDTIYLYPAADTSYVTPNNVQTYYSTACATVVNDTDTPQIPQPMHLAIVDYAVAFAFETRGFGDKATDNWNKYAAKLMAYDTERSREREDDQIIMKSYKNRIRT